MSQNSEGIILTKQLHCCLLLMTSVTSSCERRTCAYAACAL